MPGSSRIWKDFLECERLITATQNWLPFVRPPRPCPSTPDRFADWRHRRPSPRIFASQSIEQTKCRPNDLHQRTHRDGAGLPLATNRHHVHRHRRLRATTDLGERLAQFKSSGKIAERLDGLAAIDDCFRTCRIAGRCGRVAGGSFASINWLIAWDTASSMTPVRLCIRSRA